ncbi:helix-turn-helix transcriptional regulator [Nocardia thailandica]|uniref:Helix-turn-helix transcriptional regulator n=1 Tax=Nocardia thailandica TaxID=257275 RepID=A0ABW6PH39_9NOCA|nr:helix-turn-helix transcriptional regulator [Nocardia thailandica]
MNTGTGKVIQERRRLLGLSQPALAAAIGVSSRQITRYESEEQSPTLPVAIRLADALEISLAELAGIVDTRVDLGGDWWAAWQRPEHGDDVEVAPVTIRHEGDHLLIDSAAEALAAEVDSARVRGEMRMWDGEALTGWVRGMDIARPVGTIYYALDPQGAHAVGSWVTKSVDGRVLRGWSALARDRSDVEKLLTELVRGEGAAPGLPGARR